MSEHVSSQIILQVLYHNHCKLKMYIQYELYLNYFDNLYLVCFVYYNLYPAVIMIYL